MNLMEVIYARRSVRAYTDAPVSRAALETLLRAAVQAPTGMNAQPWAFGVIQDRAALKAFSDRTKAYLLEHLEQFPGLERYRDSFANPHSDLTHGATALVLIFAKPGGATPDIDCTLAAENLMLAACDLGLGTCWMGFFAFLINQPQVKAELGIPEEYRVVAPIIVGHPKTGLPPVEKAAPEVVFWRE